MSNTDRRIANERRQALLIGGLTLVALALTSMALLAIASALGRVDLDMIANPVRWLTELDTAAAFDTLSNTAEVLAGVLAVAITVVAIVVAGFFTRSNTRSFYWLNLVVVSVTDVGFIAFVLMPGYLPVWPGVLGPLFWVAGAVVTTLARRQESHDVPH